jgi:hypothetical protein
MNRKAQIVAATSQFTVFNQPRLQLHRGVPAFVWLQTVNCQPFVAGPIANCAFGGLALLQFDFIPAKAANYRYLTWGFASMQEERQRAICPRRDGCDSHDDRR